MPEQIFEVVADVAGMRLDAYLTNIVNRWPSRAFVQKMIDNGGVTKCGKVLKSGYKVLGGDLITVVWQEPQALDVVSEDIDLDILYEDSDLIVVNKPRGMVVHPAAGNFHGTLVNALLHHCHDLSGIGGVIRPGIVHRIDKDTSGVLVVAKNDFTHLGLASQLKNHDMKRIYIALVYGNPPESGRVEGAIGRHPVDRKKMAIVTVGGKPAATNYRVLEYFNGFALMELSLETGRTHQIRVHMTSIGYPLVGDPLYGVKKSKIKFSGQALHAAVLGFVHPRTGEYLEFTAPLPNEMKEILHSLRQK